MEIVQKNSELKLFQDLKENWVNCPEHRCLQLKFSQVRKNKKEWFEDVLKVLRRVFEERPSQVYVCHDDDIFIVNREITQKTVSVLLSNLPHDLLLALPSQGLAALFEVGVDWPKLRHLCEKKIENFELIQLQKKRQKAPIEIDMVDRRKALETLDPDLISSLSMRRELREEPIIMVVEDDPMSQRLVNNTISKKYKVNMTDDGQGAIMNYVKNAPDVLFLDIGLPDINGHKVLEKLFALDPDAYVVMFSGNGDKENILKAVGLGAKGFVGKPFSQDKIFEYIAKSPFIQNKQIKENHNGNLVR